MLTPGICLRESLNLQGTEKWARNVNVLKAAMQGQLFLKLIVTETCIHHRKHESPYVLGFRVVIGATHFGDPRRIICTALTTRHQAVSQGG